VDLQLAISTIRHHIHIYDTHQSNFLMSNAMAYIPDSMAGYITSEFFDDTIGCINRLIAHKGRNMEKLCVVGGCFIPHSSDFCYGTLRFCAVHAPVYISHITRHKLTRIPMFLTVRDLTPYRHVNAAPGEFQDLVCQMLGVQQLSDLLPLSVAAYNSEQFWLYRQMYHLVQDADGVWQSEVEEWCAAWDLLYDFWIDGQSESYLGCWGGCQDCHDDPNGCVCYRIEGLKLKTLSSSYQCPICPHVDGMSSL
jgi:hypothetical protein